MSQTDAWGLTTTFKTLVVCADVETNRKLPLHDQPQIAAKKISLINTQEADTANKKTKTKQKSAKT